MTEEILNIPSAVPVKISHGDLWATKNYVHDFAESPDGSKILYRYFPDAGHQPVSRVTAGLDTQMWMAGTDGSNPVKLFDLPVQWTELGHGGDTMMWLNDDKFYFNGIVYQLSTGSILWQIPDTIGEYRPVSTWSFPVNGWLYVNVRAGKTAGYYKLDPFALSAPDMRPVIGADEMAPFLGGDVSTYQYTYIKLSPGGKYLYFVMVFEGKEYGYTSDADGTGIVPIGHNDDRSMPWNGHTIWFDEDHFVYPNYPDRNTKMCGRFGGDQTVIAPRANHITMSPDKKWLACDGANSFLRLYRIGSQEVFANLMTPEQAAALTDFHPSFSRDGKRVYFQGRSHDTTAVFYVDVSKWTG